MKLIKPNKPEFFELPYLESAIFLSETEVDVSRIRVDAIADGFREQKERHITIIGGQAVLISNKLSVLDKVTRDKLTQELIGLSDKFSWEFVPGKIYKIAKEGCFGRGSTVVEKRESYIRAVDMPDMESFYKEINNLLGLSIPTQFPHITLFTKGERPNPDWHGIPIPSNEEFYFMHPIEINE